MDKNKYSNFIMAIIVPLLFSQQSFALEGGIGRPITGMQVVPLNGLLPTEEGGVLSLSSIYYEGNLSRSRSVPIIGQLAGGMDYKLSYNLVNGLFVWDTSPKWTLASSVAIPIQYTNIGASLNQLSKEESATRVGDVLFSPVIANYHINPIMHALFGLNVYAPTGSYHDGRLSNAGLNVWTFVPNVAMTTILPEMNAELTATAAYEIYSKNKDTDYQNGDVFRMDLLALKRFGELGGSGMGAGINFGWIEQVNNDSGPLADVLNGFKGRAVGVGPILSYEKKGANYAFSSTLRGIYEFDVKNRPEGEAYQLSVSFQY